MTLNLIFITVTIRRNAKTLEQQLHDEQVKERFEELNIKKAELHITHLQALLNLKGWMKYDGIVFNQSQ